MKCDNNLKKYNIFDDFIPDNLKSIHEALKKDVIDNKKDVSTDREMGVKQ